jgi:dCTP diphosphatase
MDVERFQKSIKQFVVDREWQRYHTPKNVAIALSVEVSELLEHFQWMEELSADEIREDTDVFERIKEEFADSMIYLLRFADLMGIDIEQSVAEKIKKNKQKYPIETEKGTFVKYSHRKEN